MADDEQLSDADYHFGAETLAWVFEHFLKRHAVEFEVVENRFIMRVGKTEVVFLTQPDWTPPEFKRMQETPGSKKILVRAVDVRQS
jgi:hypothetical protein